MLTILKLLLSQVRAENPSLWSILCLIIVTLFCNTSRASAQITPDATLPNNSLATPNANGDLITITGGTDAGNNLFHSFQEFSVIKGQTAFFENGLTIDNIFSRVTGSSISNIDGIIRANGAANLFLLNPNGIIFGPNAALNIGGSFVGSTADSIQFNDGSLFSAVDPQAPPLLTINIPTGLQYGAQPGNIIIQGNGNNTGFRDPSANDQSLVKDFRPAGLQVATGQTLALIGGNIALDGGNLTAAEGRIELGSVREGLVKLDADGEIASFDYQEVAEFLDIALVNAASVEVSGNSSGTVNVQGQNISLTDASAILANTSGDGTAGSITLNGTESVQVTGISQTQIPFVSYVSTGTAPGSTGQGADLNINTSYLLVAGGAQVDSPVFGSGEGGDININAGRVELIAGSPLAGSSGLFAPIVPGAIGDGGDINLVTDSLLVAGGAQAFPLTASSGKAGDFNIKAQDIELNGTSPSGTPSGLFSNTFLANGDGGNVTIETDSLALIDGANIGSTVGVRGTGKAGNIDIKANTIELINSASVESPSSIATSVLQGATGFGGDITIEVNSLSISDGAQINSLVEGNGDGGKVTITANEINLQGYSNRPSGIFTVVNPGATGNSGDVTVTTDNLTISEGAQIAVGTASSGSAGNLKLTVSDTVELTGNANEVNGGSSGLFSNAVFGDGNGGNLDVTTNQLIIKDGATISASNFLSSNATVPPGTGSAGNININAQAIELDGAGANTPASITAATFDGGGGDIALNSNNITATNGAQVTAATLGTGDGGNITISTTEFNLTDRAQVSVNSTGLGQAGNIAIASDTLTLDQGQITATSVQTGGGDINLVTDSLSLDNNSLISTSVLDSTGGGGNITIDNSGFIIGENNSDIKADAVFGPGGNIQITAQGIFFDLDSEITASSRFGTDGIVEIELTEADGKLSTVSFPDRLSTQQAVIVSSCPVPETNTFTVTGSGGLPENPSSYLRGRTVWQDTRRLASNSANSEDMKSESTSFKSDRGQENAQVNPIVESQGWIINQRGKVELVAANPQRISPTAWYQGINCGAL